MTLTAILLVEVVEQRDMGIGLKLDQNVDIAIIDVRQKARLLAMSVCLTTV
jgi:hypothetical protein